MCREGGVGGEELLDEAIVVLRAAEHEQLEVGERLGEVGLRLRVHKRRIGGRSALL